jgi:hypothetical protein
MNHPHATTCVMKVSSNNMSSVTFCNWRIKSIIKRQIYPSQFKVTKSHAFITDKNI